ncbi:MAG TPA: hypothetical protein VES91_05350, partial [Burkholderiaceae bacterium]|nr:hypothetical protein [Burkholderiaceae bacterium]
MKFDQLPSALQAWLRNMRERSLTRDAVLQALLDAKYDKVYANDVIDAVWREVSTPAAAAQSPSVTAASAFDVQPGVAAAEPQSNAFSSQLTDMPNSLETPDRAIEMLFVIESPRVVLVGNLLSDDECDLLVSLSRDKLERSSVVNASTGVYDIHPHRTS